MPKTNSSNQIWVVIPAYNESKYISRVLKKVAKQTKNFIVVDDGSSDDTVVHASKHASTVLKHPVNLGKGAAMKTGADYAFETLGASAVIFLDSDDQHDPQEIKKFVRELKKNVQIVFGARSLSEKMPFFRQILNRTASVLNATLFGVYISDIPCGYKAISRKGYQKLRWDSTGYAVEMEIAARTAKFKIPFSTIPIKTIYHDLDRGMTVLDTLGLVAHIMTWRISL